MTESDFYVYDPINNISKVEFVNQIRAQPDLMEDLWYVTEKAHGANFCFVWDGRMIRCGRRRSLLCIGDKFYGYDRVLNRYAGRILQLVQNFDSEVRIYGELIGGSYPGIGADTAPVQTGVYYSADYEFYGFDIMVDREFLDYDRTMELFETHRFVYAKPLFAGSFEQCADYNPEFESKIYRAYGMPKIPDNIAEGVVIRPQSARRISGARPLLKFKSSQFQEEVYLPSSHINEWIELATRYATSLRLDEIKSKFAPEEFIQTDLAGILARKAICSFHQENPALSKMIPRGDRKIINDAVYRVSQDLIN